MRRLTIELDIEEMQKFESNQMMDRIRNLEILQFLREGPEEFAAIFRIEFADSEAKVEDFIDDDILDLQLLDHSDGAYTYFIKSRPARHHEGVFDHSAAGGYLSLPFEIRDGKARITYLGSGKQIKQFLDGVEKIGIRYRIVSMTDARFGKDSPLSRLTEKQRKVLVAAYQLGYYDEPRRISSEELAKRMKIGSSTLINHRRSAERHILAELVGK